MLDLWYYLFYTGIDYKFYRCCFFCFVVGLFLSRWFPYRETFTHFLNRYKFSILQLFEQLQMLKFVKIQIIFTFFYCLFPL